jgi:catechol 2,3-dioxygenase-like lactoylglutathione lyase family enzyme
MAAPALALRHFGVFVTDLDRMVDFYTRVLGLTVTDRGALPDRYLVFLSRDPDEHHQFVLVSGRPADVGFNVVNQISFRLAALADLKTMYATLLDEGVKELRTVSHGNAWSVYCQDPDGNRVELYAVSPWYTPQPYAEPIDLTLPDAEILRRTEAECRARPGFKTQAEWRAEIMRRMGLAG